VRNAYLESGCDLSRPARVIDCLSKARDFDDLLSVPTARVIAAS
jgi:hypothetical protein